MQTEVWRACPGYEGEYEVSNLGRVRSLDRNCPGPGGKPEFHPGKVLSPFVAKRGGYLCLTLTNRKKRTVHSLVAEAFIGPRPPKADVMHLNGIRTDNRPENLRYGTRKENLNQTYEYGGRQASGKLSVSDVQRIRRRLSVGEAVTAIARDYGVNSAAIYHIRSGRSFAWLPAEQEGCL